MTTLLWIILGWIVVGFVLCGLYAIWFFVFDQADQNKQIYKDAYNERHQNPKK